MKLNRLAIGTAQFGLSYGIANQQGQVNIDQVAEILRVASSFGVDTLDTAIAAWGDFPEAERYYAKAISLPLYFGLTESAQDNRVGAVLREVLG